MRIPNGPRPNIIVQVHYLVGSYFLRFVYTAFWEADFEFGPLTQLAFDVDGPFMCLNDKLADAKSEAASPFLTRTRLVNAVKPIEYQR